MNGSGSDEEGAMTYFLPIGIADDSPPKRSVLPPGSFGPIGGRTPTAANASLGPRGFHAAGDSPSAAAYLAHHRSDDFGAATASSTPTAGSIGSNTMASASMGLSTASSNFLLSDLGGEIHEPQSQSLTFGSSSDPSTASIGSFGFSRTFRRDRSEDENAPSSLFGRGSSSYLASPRGNPFRGGSGGNETPPSFYNRTSTSDLSSPFMTTAQDPSPFGTSSPHNWPASSPSSSSAASTASAAPRRVLQAPPGLSEPPGLNSPRLGLGGDYMTSSFLGSSTAAGTQQSHLASGGSSSTFGGAYANAATSTPTTMSDAFRSASSHAFPSNLGSPLHALHLPSPDDLFARPSHHHHLSSERRGGITNPDLAELNSLSVKVHHERTPSASSRPVNEPIGMGTIVNELQARQVAVQGNTAKHAATSSIGLDQQSAQSTSGSSHSRRATEKKKPASPTMRVNSAGGRADHRSAGPKSSGVAVLQPKPPAATPAPRSAPAAASVAVSDGKHARGKRRGGPVATDQTVSSSIHRGHHNQAGGSHDEYESGDSAEFSITSDSGESTGKARLLSPLADSGITQQQQQTRREDKNERKNARSSASKKKTIADKAATTAPGAGRKQMYREKLSKDTATSDAPQPTQQQQVNDDNLIQQRSTEEAEPTSDSKYNAVASKPAAKQTQPRAARRGKDAAATTTDQMPAVAEDKEAVPLAATATQERVESSDSEVSMGKKPAKQSKSTLRENAKSSSRQVSKQSPSPVDSSKSDKQESAAHAERSDQAAAVEAAVSEPPKEKAGEKQTLSAKENTSATSILDETREKESDSVAKNKKVPELPVSDAVVEDNKLTNETSNAKETPAPPHEEISPTEHSAKQQQQSPPAAETVEPAVKSNDNTTPEKKQQPQQSLAKEKELSQSQPAHPPRKEKLSKREKTESKKKNSASKQQKKDKRRDSPPPRSKGSSSSSFDVSDISDLDNVVGAPDSGSGIQASASSARQSAVRVDCESHPPQGHREHGAVPSRVCRGRAVQRAVAALAAWRVVVHSRAPRGVPCDLDASPHWLLLCVPVRVPVSGAVRVSVGTAMGTRVPLVRIPGAIVLHERSDSDGHDVPHPAAARVPNRRHLAPQFLARLERYAHTCSRSGVAASSNAFTLTLFSLLTLPQCLSAVFLGSELVVQWFQMALALYSLHSMVASDEDWHGLGDDDDELSCQSSMSMMHHHSIADYSHHPAPSSAQSIQKTKRLDRRALAYVRGRKFR
ncbi:hypothetical protein FI667_g1174, partial [Globisporangium splendens]